MVPDFEWIRKSFRDEDEKRVSHYLVDPCGQVRADIDEPTGRGIAFKADLYFAGLHRYTDWITLDLAKTHVALAYENHLINEVKRHEAYQSAGIVARPETPALACGTAPSEGDIAPASVPANADESPGTA